MKGDKLVELKDPNDIRLAKRLIARFHPQGMPPGGGLASGSRFFVLERDEKWVAIAWIHKPSTFRYLFAKFRIGLENSYFLRRILTLSTEKGAVKLLKLLGERLKNEGKEKIVEIGTTPTRILGLNPKRNEFIIQNQGDETVYLSKFEDVAVSGTKKGYMLKAGESLERNRLSNPNLIKQPVYGVVSAISSKVWVWEA